jgi:hypothetical protein
LPPPWPSDKKKKKKNKTKKNFSPPLTSRFLHHIITPKLKLKTNSYSSIFSSIAITHTCPAKISFFFKTD